jgi:stage II sporulation protein AA (anti-sigma F factor antagonist)
MEHQITRRADHVIVHIAGKMTYKDHAAFTTVGGLFADGVTDMELDFTSASFIDSAAIGALLILQDEARRKGASLKMVGVAGQIRRVFIATDIAKALNWQDAVPQADPPTAS